jgi:hypothetical protein
MLVLASPSFAQSHPVTTEKVKKPKKGSAVKAGKDVTVGSVKGVDKIGKGVGHALKKIL